MIRRRDFLRGIPAGFLAATVLPPWLAMAAEEASVVIPGKAGMIVRSARFFDLEMPPEFFDSWITPVPHFFLRNHMLEPGTLDSQTWRLTISGELKKPLSLSLADLAQFKMHSVTNTLECAGNGRGLYSRTSRPFNGKRERWVRLVSPAQGSRTFSGARASNPPANTSCCAA